MGPPHSALLHFTALLAAAQAAPASSPSPAAADGCELAIVGAGPGGVYTAWRLAVDTATLHPASICIFERAERVGGRTFSLYGQGTRRDLTVELGAYRFCGSPNATGKDGRGSCGGCEMCMPMMNNLIKGKLGLQTAPYQPGGGPADEEQLVKVVDAEGQNHGLARYVERMANASAAAGVRFFLGHEVLLNTPLLPTLRIVRSSPSLKPHFEHGAFPAFLRVPHAWRHVKLYVHYDWAWWRTLGLTSGDFHLYGPTPEDGGRWDGQPDCGEQGGGRLGPLQTCSADTLPLEGRYHDGHVRCDDGNATGLRCRGFIEATYTSDGVHPPNVTFFEYYQSNTDPPFVYVDRQSSADGAELLAQVHERLITKHTAALQDAGIFERASAALPTNALLSMWDPKSPGFGAGTHGMSFAKIPGGKYAPGAEAGTVPAKTIRPFPTLKLYIANEAFHPADWGEGSLEMAENVVHKFFGVAPPSWIAAPTYRAILFGPPDAPSPPPPPGPGPTPSPPTPGPPSGKKCPPQQLLNATIVCVHTVDLMDCNVTLACPHHSDHFVHVDFADIGTPRGACGGYSVDADCSGAPGEAAHIVAQMCLGQPECSFGPNTNVLNPSDPMICDGVVKSMSIQLSCGTGTPVQPPPAPPPPSPSPPSPPSVNSSCAGPFGKDLPPLLRSRPSGTAVPDWLVMAAPFTPFYANGSVNTGAVLPLAKLFKERLGITAVWVMGMRGQFDAMTVAQRKAVAEAWVRAGKATGLFTIIQCGSSAVAEAAEVAAFVESIGGDAIGSLGPFEELCSNTECVVDWVAPVAAAAPHTPFFYYHTPGWNGKSINGVKMYDWFRAAETKIPTNVGVKFESYSDEEFKQTCAAYGETKVMIYAPCGSLGHFEQGTPGRGAFIQAAFGPMCHRIKAAYDKGDTAGMHAAAALQTHCDNAGGNFVERYFYGGFGVAGVEFGPPLPPQPTQSPATLAAMNETLHKCGFYEQRWP